MTAKRHSKSYRLFKFFIYKHRSNISDALDLFFKGLKNGAIDTKKTSFIIHKYATQSEDITKEDEKFIKVYVYDLLKMAGIGIPFILLPGASLIIPFIIKAADKRNIDLIPSNFKNKSKNI